MFAPSIFVALCVSETILLVHAQINLGSFNLNKNPLGQWDLGFSQAANILGFGGDRGFKFTGGQQGIGLQTNQGALVGGERVGVDSGLGLDQQNGLGLGSMLSFGNQPSNAPGGQLGSFIQNIGRFFQNLGGPQAPAPPPSGSLGSVGVPALNVRPAPQIPTDREEIDTEDLEGNGERSTFPTLIETNESGSGVTAERGRKNEGEARRPNNEFPNYDDEDSDIMGSIDEKSQVTESPTRFKFQPTSTKNPRQLPGLVEMGDS